MPDTDIQIGLAAFSVLRAAAPWSLESELRLKLEEMTNPSRQSAFLAGRQIIARMVPEAMPRLYLAPSGKPMIADNRNWGLSISHSGRHVVCGVSRCGAEVGVDLEKRSSRPNLFDNAEEFFHPREIDWLRAETSETFEARFFRLWTMKEAIAKAEGSGISTFRHFSLEDNVVRDWPEKGCEWHCRHWSLPGGWDLAVAWSGSDRRQIHLTVYLAGDRMRNFMNFGDYSGSLKEHGALGGIAVKRDKT